MKYDVLGIGSLIVDMTIKVEDSFLKEQKLKKSVMNITDKDTLERLIKGANVVSKAIAGSAANTIYALSDLGIRTALIGKLNFDDLGKFYQESLKKAGIYYDVPFLDHDEIKTASSIILVTPDAERTMCTYLGASSELKFTDINEELVKESDFIYVEGYSWDKQNLIIAVCRAFEHAKKHEKKCIFSLSDAYCVKRHKDDFIVLLNSKQIDVLFANKSEIEALYGENWKEEATKVCSHIVVTMGKEGALSIVDGKPYHIKAKYVEKVVDTTGAGDIFAAGYLCGLVKKKPPNVCLEIGSACAAEIISHYGTKPKISLKDLIEE